MIDALYISENALRVNQAWIENISHNVANLNTLGFKKSDVQFVDLVAGGNRSETVLDEAGLGVNLSQYLTNFQVGQLKQSANRLDVAIDGDGFFEVVMENGESAYTKNGRLSVSEDGRLALLDGTPLAADIFIPSNATEIRIDASGRVSTVLDNGEDIVEVGELMLTKVSNPQSLTSLGNGLYVASDQAGELIPVLPGEEGAGQIIQGYIELSNVDLIEEMSDIMLAQRSYQINARMLQVTDQILETINNLRR